LGVAGVIELLVYDPVSHVFRAIYLLLKRHHWHLRVVSVSTADDDRKLYNGV